MSMRIAHRPRYRHMRQTIVPSRHSRQPFLHSRWSYRRQVPSYEKHPLGYGLSLIPFGYYKAGLIILPQL